MTNLDRQIIWAAFQLIIRALIAILFHINDGESGHRISDEFAILSEERKLTSWGF